jgi:voltage-gated potassium channel
MFFIFVIFYSYVLRIFELPYYRVLPKDDGNYREFDSMFTSFWLVIITLTTVGYGDFFPCTFPGRLVASMIALTGSFLMALIVTTVTGTM